MEAWLSGRKHRIRNAADLNRSQGFKSSRLRHEPFTSVQVRGKPIGKVGTIRYVGDRGKP